MAVKQEKKVRVRIGTRGSPLALRQAQIFDLRLHAVLPNIKTEIIPIKTSGEWRPEDGEQRLSAASGSKALFTKEIEDALLRKQIDIAVHSMKDVETITPKGLIIPCMLLREDPRDVFVSEIAQDIDSLPQGAVVGTSSVRRQAFLLAKRPDLKIVPLRGNVDTRLKKIKEKQVHATLLAYAGLKRLGQLGAARSIIDMDDMLPAVGQGAIGIQAREADKGLVGVLAKMSDDKTYTAVASERAALTVLGGSCHTPIGIYTQLHGLKVHIRARLASPDGKHVFDEEEIDHMNRPEDAVKFGQRLGDKLKKKVPKELLS